jgi:general secretion pathway protein C
LDWGGQTWRDLIAHPERWAMGLCAAIAVALIATEAVGLVTTLRGNSPSARPVTSSATVAADPASQITRANLFGIAPAQRAGNLPETQLQLTLRGVFTADDPALASAIIETPDGKMQIVKTGGGLGGDATLQQVHANRVVIARAGTLENLYFPTASSTGLAAAGVAMEAPPVAAGPIAGDEDERKANILRRLEELRARGALSR